MSQDFPEVDEAWTFSAHKSTIIPISNRNGSWSMPSNRDTEYWTASIKPKYGSGVWAFNHEVEARIFAESPAGKAALYIPKPLIDENFEKAFDIASINGVRPGRTIREKQLKELRILSNEVRGGKFEEGFRSGLMKLQPELDMPETTGNLINNLAGARISSSVRNDWITEFHEKRDCNDKIAYLIVGLALAGEHRNFTYRQPSTKPVSTN